jgi:hypothetical protein
MNTRANSKDNSRRKFHGGKVTQFSNPDCRRTEAEERQKAWAGLTPVQQLKELDKRLGVGKGAARQRARLLKMKVTKATGVESTENADDGDRLKTKKRRAQERKERPSK